MNRHKLFLEPKFNSSIYFFDIFHWDYWFYNYLKTLPHFIVIQKQQWGILYSILTFKDDALYIDIELFSTLLFFFFSKSWITRLLSIIHGSSKDAMFRCKVIEHSIYFWCLLWTLREASSGSWQHAVMCLLIWMGM